jgi:hypothetical protein
MNSAANGKSTLWVESEQVDVGLGALQELAKSRKKGVSLLDAIARMMPGIEKSLAAGYTHQEICNTLMDKAGIAIAPSTLKLYVNRVRKEKDDRKGRRGKSKGSQKAQAGVTEQVAIPSSSSPDSPEKVMVQTQMPIPLSGVVGSLKDS